MKDSDLPGRTTVRDKCMEMAQVVQERIKEEFKVRSEWLRLKPMLTLDEECPGADLANVRRMDITGDGPLPCGNSALY